MNRPAKPAAKSSFVEGKDYMVVERVRFLDRMGFDRPVEAFSIVFPKGWKTDGGVKWGSVGGCRGEIIASYVKASSPDGAFQFEVFPVRTFGYASDPMLLQTMQVGAQAGGCRVNQPFDANQYIEGFGRMDLGAKVSNIRTDEARTAMMRVFDEQVNAIGRQSNQSQQTTVSYGDLQFPDGSEGLLNVVVTNLLMRKPDFVSGGVTNLSTTVAAAFLIRFPAGQKEQAAKLYNMFSATHRTNPVWNEAKSQFLTRLGQIEHAGNMERIRLMGEQSRAYAREQSAAADQRMRDWEARQASQDNQHRKFVQAIREVETWKDANGAVELTSGYNRAFSRGDGSYILTNSPTFDPAAAFLDQNWKPMQKEQ